MNKSEIKTKRDNGAGFIYYLVANQRWCTKIQTGYDVETGKPKIKAFYGKTHNEARLKSEEFNNSITVI